MREKRGRPERGNRACLAAAIDALVATAERGQNLVADGACRRGDGVDVVLFVDEIDKRARTRESGRDVGHVKRQEVHRDASDDGNPLAGDAGTAAIDRGSEPAIGVADGDRGDAAGAFHAMRGTVSNAYTPVNVAQLQNSSFQPTGLCHRTDAAGRAVHAVEPRPGTVEVEVVVGPEEDA